MKSSLCSIHILACISSVLSVILDPGSRDDSQALPPTEHLHPNDEEPRSFNDALRVCFAERVHGTWECVNRGALTALQSWNDEDCLDLGDVRLERSEGESRNILDLDWDPKDFGNVMRAASRLLERRNVKWDLGTVYPGLQMRIGPTLSAGSGMLEFVMDERSGSYRDRQLGAGRLLVRQLVLPFLLGFKFNLAALLPLLFGALIVITKKALLLTKVALFIAGLLGWNSLVGGLAGGTSTIFNTGLHGAAQPSPGFVQTPGLQEQPSYPYLPYRGESKSPGYPFGQHVIREIVNVYETASQEADEGNRRRKNFLWTRNEP